MLSEFFTEAIVLDREELGEFDSRIFLYTKILGRVTARAQSARKITSKLSAHIEPLNLVNARLVYGKNFQLVDALRFQKLGKDFLKILRLVKQISADNQPDLELWQLLKRQCQDPQAIGLVSKQILKIAGFDPRFAACQNCQSGNPNHFVFADAQYLCGRCSVIYNYTNSDVFAI